MEAKEKIIVALDVSTLEEVKKLVETLHEHVGCFKIGLELIASIGIGKIVGWFMDYGFGGASKLFIDGKFDDIPNTVGRAAKAVSALNVKMFNVHASAGIGSMRAAVKNKGNCLVLAVTILTSLDEDNAALIFGANISAKVLQLSRDAKIAGIGGIICSPKELKILDTPELKGLKKATPGVRPTWVTAPDDQRRVTTPFEAIKDGADYLVIGRPITKNKDPLEAVKRIVAEIEQATN